MRYIAIHDKGFTLLEVLIAVAILGIGVVSVIRLFSDGLRTSYSSSKYTMALFHARNIMEEVKYESDNGVFDDGYRWEKIVSPYTENGNIEGLKQIIVKVYWKDGVIPKEITFTTLKTMFKKTK